ncbi:MAG: hypothetical protein L6V81_02780 [Clostridium sp.]|nr:MAG: hypothetical protein L6V81_02780 [Clostridium sp.]
MGKKEMESWASSLLSYNVSNDIDYYDYYKSKFIKGKKQLIMIILKKQIN